MHDWNLSSSHQHLMTEAPTIRAVRVTEPLMVDGTLDERVYQDVPAVSEFIQTEPLEGVPASEQTEVWVLFDRDYLYISARCWDSAPESEWIANEMRRDSMNILQNENFAFLIDTFYGPPQRRLVPDQPDRADG